MEGVQRKDFGGNFWVWLMLVPGAQGFLRVESLRDEVVSRFKALEVASAIRACFVCKTQKLPDKTKNDLCAHIAL